MLPASERVGSLPVLRSPLLLAPAVALLAVCVVAAELPQGRPPTADRVIAEIKTTTPGKLSFWSLVRVNRPVVPSVRTTNWPRNEIDHFILRRQEAAGISPVDDAGPRTLLRRVFLTLTGLPPTLEEIDSYLADPLPDRHQRLVGRLLASPRFGERWGRHWLDVVRFAESSGREFNFTYPHVWPYRNYVIKALNEDKPFDRFVCEQLAGDLLSCKEPEEREELLVATSFLSVGPKRHNNAAFPSDLIDDQIDVTMRAILALTVACSRCHDHKFDPISTHDYYALAGIFQSTEALYGIHPQSVNDLVALGPNGQSMHEVAEKYETKINRATKQLEQRREALKKLRSKVKLDDTATEGGKSESVAVDQDQEGEVKKTKLKQLIDVTMRAILALTEEEVSRLEQHREKLKEGRPPRPRYSASARERVPPTNAKIAIRGNPYQLAEEVPRGFLKCISLELVPEVNLKQSGRLELARWLTSPHNPLTARVMVNRIWYHLFGRGIVETVDNFGALGSVPSHPQLLNWLASEFMDHNWSVKHLIRTILLSRVYQLGSARDERLLAVDPENVLFWRMRPRRLEAEIIRDSMLSTSGKLDLSVPEGSFDPMLNDRLVRDIKPDQLQPSSAHRSVYLPVIRDYPPKMFELFDFPSSSLVSGRRTATTVPLQELFLHNSAQMTTISRWAADYLKHRIQQDDAARVDSFFQIALGRLPTEGERVAALSLVRKISQIFDPNGKPQGNDEDRPTAKDVAWTSFCQAIYASAEFRYLVDID